MSTDVLIIGSGGREHALAWKLKQSARLGKLYVAPGNGGTAGIAQNVPIGAADIDALARFAEEQRVGLTVVGPDEPLSLGIVDLFRSRGLRIVGPTKTAAQIESSKSFAKKLMQEQKIPTAHFKVYTSQALALAELRLSKFPVVIKASGLAKGKGVYICKTLQDAEQALQALMHDKVHGDAGNEIIVEDLLEGIEISAHILCDGFSQMLFPFSQDHKRALDNDQGENTGGMGAVAPVPWSTPQLEGLVQRSIVQPTIDGLAKRGALFEGLLYPGIILTNDGPSVLEFNARFGDPETQVYMRLLQSDLLDLLEACVDHTIAAVLPSVSWRRGYAVTVVLAAEGYPKEYTTGVPITGIADAEALDEVVVFHAGTAYSGGYTTAGGRVLGVSAFAITPEDAVARAYAAVEKIRFEGMQYRKDIGLKAVRYWSSVRI